MTCEDCGKDSGEHYCYAGFPPDRYSPKSIPVEAPPERKEEHGIRSNSVLDEPGKQFRADNSVLPLAQAVSAPGEAMTAEQFWKANAEEYWGFGPFSVVMRFAEAYAAHVTAALTRERDALKS